MKTRIISLCIAFLISLFTAAVLLSPAVAGAEDSMFKEMDAVVISQIPETYKECCGYLTIVLTADGNELSYHETDVLYRGRQLILDVFTPNNDPINWEIVNVEYPLTIERGIVYALMSIAVCLIGKL